METGIIEREESYVLNLIGIQTAIGDVIKNGTIREILKAKSQVEVAAQYADNNIALDADFVLKNCPRLVEAVHRICNWVRN